MLEICFPIFQIRKAREHAGMLGIKSPIIPEDPRSAGTIGIQKQLMKNVNLRRSSRQIIRALYELGDARGFRQKIFYFYKSVLDVRGPSGILGDPRGSIRIPETRRPSTVPVAPRSSGILGVNRDHDREYSASSGLSETGERNGPKSRDIVYKRRGVLNRGSLRF
jgi:hypothetical protein